MREFQNTKGDLSIFNKSYIGIQNMEKRHLYLFFYSVLKAMLKLVLLVILLACAYINLQEGLFNYSPPLT